MPKTKTKPGHIGARMVPIDDLKAHELNANILPRDMLEKLKAHIKRTNRYPFLVVRPHPEEAEKYEILEEDHTYYGEVPGFDGVYSHADTLEECRRQLAEVLEEWLFFRISRNLPVPRAGGIELAIKKVG